MIGALITILVYILILGILWWAIDYAITNIPVPDPPAGSSASSWSSSSR